MADDDNTTGAGQGHSILEEYERDRDAHLERIAELEDRLEAAQTSAPSESTEPLDGWEAKLQRGRDLGDDGLVKAAYAERDQAEQRAQLEREQAEQAARDREVAQRGGWEAYQAETERLAASEDPSERDKAGHRLAYGQFVERVRNAEFQQHLDEQVGALMDAEAGPEFLPGGVSVDRDPYVAGMKRRLDQLEREEADPRDIARQRVALDDRIRELRENPAKLGTTEPGSQVVPGSEPPQSMAGRLADAERLAQQTGDWSEWDRLQVEATVKL